METKNVKSTLKIVFQRGLMVATCAFNDLLFSVSAVFCANSQRTRNPHAHTERIFYPSQPGRAPSRSAQSYRLHRNQESHSQPNTQLEFREVVHQLNLTRTEQRNEIVLVLGITWKPGELGAPCV